jgi:SAM-dependent methyltransferase
MLHNFNHVNDALRRAEEDPAIRTTGDALEELRKLGLDEFGSTLFSMPRREYPRLSSLLPTMASETAQQTWNGTPGTELLLRSLAFTHRAAHGYERLTDQRFHGARKLDYGCGWGRLLRLMLYFTDPDGLAGCDPWKRSIELCRKARIACDLKQSDYLPRSLPFPKRSFHFVYAFSVLTHTSLRAARAAMSAMRSVVRDDGLLAVTVRPVEYWGVIQNIRDERRDELRSSHLQTGFAFEPHRREAVDGDVTYGHTSMSREFIEETFPDWRVETTEVLLTDPYQRIVLLRPV